MDSHNGHISVGSYLMTINAHKYLLTMYIYTNNY